MKDTYSNSGNHYGVFEIKTHLWELKQGNLLVTDYYMAMVALWQELDVNGDEEWGCPKDYVCYKSKVEDERVFES